MCGDRRGWINVTLLSQDRTPEEDAGAVLVVEAQGVSGAWVEAVETPASAAESFVREIETWPGRVEAAAGADRHSGEAWDGSAFPEPIAWVAPLEGRFRLAVFSDSGDVTVLAQRTSSPGRGLDVVTAVHVTVEELISFARQLREALEGHRFSAHIGQIEVPGAQEGASAGRLVGVGPGVLKTWIDDYPVEVACTIGEGDLVTLAEALRDWSTPTSRLWTGGSARWTDSVGDVALRIRCVASAGQETGGAELASGDSPDLRLSLDLTVDTPVVLWQWWATRADLLTSADSRELKASAGSSLLWLSGRIPSPQPG